jgi:hypothetical protein
MKQQKRWDTLGQYDQLQRELKPNENIHQNQMRLKSAEQKNED